MKLEKPANTLVWIVATAFFVWSAQAQTSSVYNNGVNGNDMHAYISMSSGQVVGQEIILDNAVSSANPYLQDFSFEFYNQTFFTANSVAADVKFYYNNGAPFNGYNTPGSTFYDSGWFGLIAPQDIANGGSGTPNNVQVWSLVWQDLYGGQPDANDPYPQVPTTPMNTQLQLPSSFTIVYTFSNAPAGFGLEMFNPPGTGTNYGDYWVNSGTWSLLTNSAPYYPSGIAMVLDAAATPAPEPSVIAMGMVGGLLMTHLIRRRRA